MVVGLVITLFSTTDTYYISPVDASEVRIPCLWWDKAGLERWLTGPHAGLKPNEPA